MKSRRIVLSVMMLLLSVLAFIRPASGSSNLTEPFDSLFLLVTILSVVVLVLVLILWVYFINKFRESNEDVERNPLSHETAKKLEMTWTLVATGIVLLLIIFSFPVIFNTVDVAESSEVQGELIIVEAFSFGWNFKNETGGIINQPVTLNGVTYGNGLVIEEGTTYTFEFINVGEQAIHSFYAPGLNIKMDLIPGQDDLYYTFTPTADGVYQVHCAEYCGNGHSEMNTAIEVID